MKIHMVSEHAGPLAVLGGADAGGQNVHVAALAVALGARGHEVTVHTRRDGEDLPDRVRHGPGVTVEHVRAGPAHPVPKDDLLPYMPAFAAHLSRRWTANRPDIVHAHFWMSGHAAITAARGAAIPVVQTFHALGSVKRCHLGDEDTSPPERAHLEPRVGQEVQSVIATCRSEVGELCAIGVRPDSTVVIPCGIDLDRFTSGGEVAARGRLSRVLSIGRLVPRKGVDTVIEAIAAVPGAELAVAGGPDASGLDADPEIRRLRELARLHRVADRVIFLGRMPHTDVPALLRSADVVVSVPWYEPFGIVPVEAMACGAGVIVSAVGGHLDTVEHGVTGLHVPPKDPGRLGAVLAKLLHDTRRRRAMSRAGAARARGLYSWERVAEQTEAVYRRLITGDGSALELAGVKGLES